MTDHATDVEAIKAVEGARHFRSMDAEDSNGWPQVFTPDVHIDMTSKGSGVTSVASTCRSLVANISKVTTVHHGHMPEITFASATTTGVWAMEDEAVVAEEAVAPLSPRLRPLTTRPT